MILFNPTKLNLSQNRVFSNAYAIGSSIPWYTILYYTVFEQLLTTRGKTLVNSPLRPSIVIGIVYGLLSI